MIRRSPAWLMLLAALLLSIPAPAATAELDPDYLRTKTEWVALRGGGGNGFCASVHLFTLRWPHVYWDIARGAASGGFAGEGFALLWGGSAVGYPWHLGDSGRHELRFGAVAGAGAGYPEQNDEDGAAAPSNGKIGVHAWFVVGPEVYYAWHYAEHGAFLLGVDFFYATPGGDWEDAFFVSGFAGAAF